MEERLPEEDIEAAEGRRLAHSHEAIAPDGSGLARHLGDVHGLDVDVTLSPATLAGVHDRLHARSDAADV